LQHSENRTFQLIMGDKYSEIPVEELNHEQLVELVREYRSQNLMKANDSKQKELFSSTLNNSNTVNNNLKNISNKPEKTRLQKKENKKKKELDWSKVNTRYIALKIAYLGVNYQGFASQDHTKNTVEHEIFKALKKTKIIESESNCNYSRCGRTDKGVSALCQVIGIKARSNIKKNEQNIDSPFISMNVQNQQDSTLEKEIEYTKVLNNVLPSDIRILGWAPVGSEFDARFGCIYRTYKYFFIKENLNIEAMREAAQYYVGYHDFRNFCKINAGSVKSFYRRILSVTIVKSDVIHQSSDIDEKHALYEIIVCGYSFLWHQVRCMVSILFHIGRGEEKPELIKELLNVEKYPRRPQYTIASEYPLCLWDCVFEDVKWVHAQNVEIFHALSQHSYNMWKDNTIKTAIINTMLSNVYSSLCINKPNLFTLHNEKYIDAYLVPFEEIKFHSDMQFKERGPKYVPILQRPTGTSLEEKLQVINERKQRALRDDDEDDLE
jgi:tRNA pseudouridine38/39 synthase